MNSSHVAQVASPATAYDAAVARLFARRPERMVPGLARIRALTAALDDPQRAYRVVHVTATNGKTTLARLVASLLSAHGVRTGCYTSPHLQSVRERVRVDDAPVEQGAFLTALRQVDAHLATVAQQTGTEVTFFESLTALAFTHFAAVDVDAAVLEVGMGGRWDATNVADADVAVIGRVSIDHRELGDTVRAVAGEKAGVIKPGAVVVCGPQHRAARTVIEAEARAQGARLLRLGEHVRVRRVAAEDLGQRLVVSTPRGQRLAVTLPLVGSHQATNAALALAAAEAHLGELDADITRSALARFVAPGRLEVVPRAGRATVWLDGAHNPAGARALSQALLAGRASWARGGAGNGSEAPRAQVVLLAGVLGDKDVEGVLGALAPAVDRMVLTSPPSPRAASAERLVGAARACGHEPLWADDAEAALSAADALAGSGDVICVAGSLYTVGAVRAALGRPVV